MKGVVNMFKLEIRTGGAAYRDEDDPNPRDLGGGIMENRLDPSSCELRKNLKSVCQKLENGYTEGYIVDTCGNRTGEWSLE